MSQLSSSGLYVYQSRPPNEDERQPATEINGRAVSEEEQDIVTQANADTRKREAAMLAGLLR